MNKTPPSPVLTLGLFEKRFEGDDSLMELARLRFSEAGMSAEMHAGSPEQLQPILKFQPINEGQVVVHLPRDFNLVDEKCSQRIIELASAFAGQIRGMVLHDDTSMASRRADYVAAAWKLEGQLDRIEECPALFVEYAAGLEPDQFIQFFSDIRDLDHVSACIDIGHVGIRAARAAYARSHGGEDICELKSQGPKLREVIPDVEACVASGAAAVLDLIGELMKLHKPLHFHLHDGHPLSAFSPFGVSDHLSFFVEIPLQFEYHGRRALPPMFGPEGLGKVVTSALASKNSGWPSFTLEIHPTGERLGLGEAAFLFERWTDKTNAEKMNHWLGLLSRNHLLLQTIIGSAIPTERTGPTLQPSAPDFECGACDI